MSSTTVNTQPRILIMGPSWVGDMVLAQSLFKVLKLKNPDCLIDVAAPGWTLPLLERMPEVHLGIALPFKHGQLALLARWKFGKSLRNNGYTQAILLTNSLKSAILPFAAKIPIRTGYLGEFRHGLLNDIRPLDKQKLPRTVDRFVTLGLPANITSLALAPEPNLAVNRANVSHILHTLGLFLPAQKILGLCPGAEYGESKRWPAEYYAEVANDAFKKGWTVWLFGSAKDSLVTAKINALTGQRCTDFGGKTALGDAVDLMSLCAAVISNDSGLMHVAAALGKPLVAIYGSSNPKHTPPMNSQATVLYEALECSPCFQRTCPLGHLNCLRYIKPDRAILQLNLQ